MSSAESSSTIVEEQTLESALNPSPNTSQDLEAEVASLAVALSNDPDNSSLQSEYDSAFHQLTRINPNPLAVLDSLGLNDIPFDTPIQRLSGGQMTRLMLAHLLLVEPQFLLLDEPTNHLDNAATEWLEGWLGSFLGGVLIVSHDRTFLDNMVNTILDLNTDAHSIRVYCER
jgi:ATPase subunit of ABC transporter with duplicated ATPase domains